MNGDDSGARESTFLTTRGDSDQPAPASGETPVASTSEAGRTGESTAELNPVPTLTVGITPLDAKSSPSPVQNGSSEAVKAKVQLKTSKIPTGTKLSWAQIAR